MPHARNEGFVGRERLLEQVRRALRPDAHAARTVALPQILAIHGLGGIGKTQLAIRYVHDHATEFDVVLWVVADPLAKLATDYAELARVFDLPRATLTTEVNEQVRAVRRHLESPESGRWLLVFDNVNEPNILKDYQPTRGDGHVLITSQRSHWPKGVQSIEVQKLDRPDSIKLLLERSDQSDADAADQLADALGDFPLALAQAAGYLAEARMPLGTYLDLFQKRRAELLRRGDPPDGYTLTVFATLDLAMRRITTPKAEELLRMIACLAPDTIPRSLLRAAFSDPLQLTDALVVLGRHSLIAVKAEVVEVHRLVQAVAWDRMSRITQVRHVERAITLLEAAFPQDSQEVRTWNACKVLQPHADHATQLAERLQTALGIAAELLDRVGLFDQYRAQFKEAEDRYRRAITIMKAEFSPDDPRLARLFGHLGLVLRARGELAEAQRYQEEALRIIEMAYGPDDFRVAATLTNLGRVLGDRGALAEARRCLERALQIFDPTRVSSDPQVAITLNNLGNVAHTQGELSEARRCQEQALRIMIAAYGPDHPDVAAILNDLGIVAADQENWVEAQQYMERALLAFAACYGPEHLMVALTLGNLGRVARVLGDMGEARRCQELALRRKEAIYGPCHPEVASTLVNLGIVLAEDSEAEQAAFMFKRALEIFHQFLGDDHSKTLEAQMFLQETEQALRNYRRDEESSGRDAAADSGPGSGPGPVAEDRAP